MMSWEALHGVAQPTGLGLPYAALLEAICFSSAAPPAQAHPLPHLLYIP